MQGILRGCNLSFYKKLMENAYDDNHGITFRKKDYIRRIKELKSKKKLTKNDKIQLKLAEKDLANFKPQWIAIKDVDRELKNYIFIKKSPENYLRLTIIVLILIWIGFSIGIYLYK